MGCYGFGVSRMVAAAIEQLHDEDGIVWPPSIAPFDIEILPVNVNEEDVFKLACDFEEKLLQEGYSVILDDRDLSPGVKFKDADLVGIPFRLTIGKKLKSGKVELFHRATRKVEELPVESALELIEEKLRSAGFNELSAEP